MPNEHGRSIDFTHLSIDQAEKRGFIHRDYIAHCLRWSFVAKEMGKSGFYKDARILDVGCGVDLPLARLLYTSRYIVDEYIAIEYNHSHKFKAGGEGLAMFKEKFPLSAYGRVDFASDQVLIDAPATEEFKSKGFKRIIYVDGDNGDSEHRLPNTLVCFEVLEHVEPSHGLKLLRKMREVMAAHDEFHPEEPKATLYLSTPCYDEGVGAAGNHVNEITRDALGSILESLQFSIVENYGTFASQRDYKDTLFKMPGGQFFFDKLSDYYDSNYVATIFAPIFPQFARNNIWKLQLSKEGYVRKFPLLEDVKKPWSSSEHWADLAKLDDEERE